MLLSQMNHLTIESLKIVTCQFYLNQVSHLTIELTRHCHLSQVNHLSIESLEIFHLTILSSSGESPGNFIGARWVSSKHHLEEEDKTCVKPHWTPLDCCSHPQFPSWPFLSESSFGLFREQLQSFQRAVRYLSCLYWRAQSTCQVLTPTSVLIWPPIVLSHITRPIWEMSFVS